MKNIYTKRTLTLICLSFMVMSLSAQNLMENPGFETGLLAPWTPGPENNAVISNDAQEGSWAAKGHLEVIINGLEQGATYFWVAQAKCLADCGSSNMWIGIRDLAADSLIGNFNFTNHTDYDTARMVFTAGSGDHRFFQWGQNGGEYVTDNHVLYKEGTASLYEALEEAKNIQIFTDAEGVQVNIDASIPQAEILVHDISGKLIFQKSNLRAEQTIERSEFPVSGFYVVTVLTEKTRKVGKVLIENQ